MRAGKHPLALVGRGKLRVRVVFCKAALGAEDALAQPAEGRCAGFRLGHVPRRPAPGLISNQPADGAALQVALVVRTLHPQGHAIGKVDGGVAQFVFVCRVQGFNRQAVVEEFSESPLGLIACVVVILVKPQGRPGEVRDDVAEGYFNGRGLGALHGGDDAHQPGARVDHFLHHVAQHRRVADAEPPRNR